MVGIAAVIVSPIKAVGGKFRRGVASTAAERRQKRRGISGSCVIFGFPQDKTSRGVNQITPSEGRFGGSMRHITRAAIVATVSFLQSANAPAGSLTAFQIELAHHAIALKPQILNSRTSMLTESCPEGWRRNGDALLCALVLNVIINEFEDRGYAMHLYCPPARTPYDRMYDAIADHVIIEKPDQTERTVDVALAALRWRFPCGTARAK